MIVAIAMINKNDDGPRGGSRVPVKEDQNGL